MHKAGVGLALILACSRSASALNPALDVNQYAHTAWTIREGVLKNIVTAIAQTPDGYLWLGTEAGIVRFDGVRFVSWQPPAGEHLPGTYVTSLMGARDGRLWIGTRTGLASWKDGRLVHYPEIAGIVGALLEDQQGTVWVGSRAGAGRLCAIRSSVVQCFGEEGDLGRGVESLLEENGNLWVGADNGLWRWRPGTPRRYAMSGAPDVTGITKLDGGPLLLADGRGVKELVADRIEPYPIGDAGTPPRAGRFLRDRDGGVWFATSGQGLLHMHQAGWDRFGKSDGLSDDGCWAIFEDREGSVWVATADGLDRFRDLAVSSITSKQGLSSDLVAAVLPAQDGSIWLGTPFGLNRVRNGQIKIYRNRDGLPADSIYGLLEDQRGRIWVSTGRGQAYLQGERFVPVRSSSSAGAEHLVQQRDGSLWVVDIREGLIPLEEHGAQAIPWSAMGHKDIPLAVAADAGKGGIWLGFFEGGVLHFKDGQVRDSYTATQGLGTGMVGQLHVDPDGSVWAATAGGLSRIHDNHIATLNSRNGLPCDGVNWMMRDDEGSTWLFMPCGLARISGAEMDAWIAHPDRAVKYTLFDSADGVRLRAIPVGYSPKVAKSRDGRLFFAGENGVTIIDPRHFATNNLPPPVHIEKIKADGEDHDAVHGLKLPALVRDVSIEYTALSLAAPEKVHFKYKLEGQDKDWVEVVNKRDVQYTNLKPRSYRFRVIASNNSGVWNEPGDSLEFSVAPAYYQTNWFLALLAAAAIATMAAAYRARMWQVQRESRRLKDVIDTIPAYVWSALPDGSVDFINRRWLEFSGFSLDQARGWGWAELVQPEDRARLLDAWRTALKSGEAMEAEARMRGADGQYRWMSVRALPRRDEAGRIVKWYGKSLDIEDLKRAEEERKKLRQLEADLEHTNRVSMMGELSASIAHEVNQPLAGIVSNGGACLRFLDMDAPDLAEVRDAVRDIVRDGKRAGEVIKRIRALTKRTSAPREVLDLNEVVREVLAIIKDEAKVKRVVIRTQLADDIPTVSGDRVQLQQVLLNLVMNGMDAMSNVNDRARELTIVTRRIEAEQVQVTVTDTGTGLDPAAMSKIFQAFYTTKASGMGMGLSISRSIIENHGGRLWATPNPGPGTSFHFTLPRCDAGQISVEAAAPRHG